MLRFSTHSVASYNKLKHLQNVHLTTKSERPSPEKICIQRNEQINDNNRIMNWWNGVYILFSVYSIQTNVRTYFADRQEKKDRQWNWVMIIVIGFSFWFNENISFFFLFLFLSYSSNAIRFVFLHMEMKAYIMQQKYILNFIQLFLFAMDDFKCFSKWREKISFSFHKLNRLLPSARYE